MGPGAAGLMLVLPLAGAGAAAGLGAAVLTVRLEETGPRRASPILMIGLAALGAAAGAWSGFGPAPIVVTALLGWSLILIAAVDARHFWLPDWLTLPLLAGGLATTALFDRPALMDHLIGAAVGFAVLRVIGTRAGIMPLGDLKVSVNPFGLMLAGDDADRLRAVTVRDAAGERIPLDGFAAYRPSGP